MSLFYSAYNEVNHNLENPARLFLVDNLWDCHFLI